MSGEWERGLLDEMCLRIADAGPRLKRFEALPRQTDRGVHLGVFVEPYLSFIIKGAKSVESRFSRRPCPPYKRVAPGDVILLKRSAGPIEGICEVADRWYYELDPKELRRIRREFAEAMCATDPSFWTARQDRAYATLMRLHHVHRVPPVRCHKTDRRGWVILNSKRIADLNGLFESG